MAVVSTRSAFPLCVALCALGLAATSARATDVAADGDELHLILPTSNDALLRGDGAGFYMYTNRLFRGVRSRPWEGGQYGFVRDQVDTDVGVVFTRFHEGVDIRPLYRDARGEPLDTVRAIGDGEVVYVNTAERRSSYGKYVVVEHWWSGSPFYSLYAHLGRVEVEAGERVAQGDRLGRIGYTGPGLDRRRAHLHFEINLLLNRQFPAWYQAHYRRDDPNHHGLFNGINLAGLDVAALYLALHENPSLTIKAFLREQPAAFKVVVPNEGVPDLFVRHPWLLEPPSERDPVGWTIHFAQSGLPLYAEPSRLAVPEPRLAEVIPEIAQGYYRTNRLLERTRRDVRLSNRGRRYVDLLLLGATAMETLELLAPPVPEPEPALELRAVSVPVPEPLAQEGRTSVEVLRVEEQPATAAEQPPVEEPAPEKKKRRVRGW